MAFSPDGRRALTGSPDGTKRLWDLETGREARVLKGHSGAVWSVAFSRDGRRALSGSTDKTIRLWDLETGQEVRVFKGHSDSVLGVVFSPTRGALHPLPLTVLCACGTWKTGARCACSKATPTQSWAWPLARMGGPRSPAPATRRCGYVSFRQTCVLEAALSVDRGLATAAKNRDRQWY